MMMVPRNHQIIPFELPEWFARLSQPLEFSYVDTVIDDDIATVRINRPASPTSSMMIVSGIDMDEIDPVGSVSTEEGASLASTVAVLSNWNNHRTSRPSTSTARVIEEITVGELS